MKEQTLDQRKIDITELPKEIPDFTSSYEPKDSLIKKWIINWILKSVAQKTIKENDILPNKSQISDYLGVSVGTVQNAIRYVEDEGLLKSKQRLGTMISNASDPIQNVKKSTSKREKTIEAIQRVIVQKAIKVGNTIPSTRKMAQILGVSQNTTRLAYEYLAQLNIISSRNTRGNDSNWILEQNPQIKEKGIRLHDSLKSETLVDKTTQELKVYFGQNFAIGDKLPSHDDLAKILNVSIKTVHDSIINLSKKGYVISRRGRYGTILAKNPLKPAFEPLKENSIFAKAEDAAIYSYQKIEKQIIQMIKDEFKAGDKLPSMQALSNRFDISTNTIRKALTNLANQGYITFGRGRFGGTFLIDVPEEEEKQTYQWLSINPDFI